MLKVFLVEDEYVVREGIKNNVPWSEHDFLFCGEAGDGEYAYTLIRQQKPDILITDIKMPFMNGLELSRLVKQDFPDMKIIILSGYEEFDFAKEAINIGVEEYLLKPINADALLRTVKEVAKKILAERKEKENLLKFKQEMKENEIETRRKFFHELISGQQPLWNKLEKGRQLGIDLTGRYFNIVLFKVTSIKHGSGEFSSRLIQIQAELNQYFENEGLISFERYLEGMALLLKADTLEEMELKKKKCVKDIEAIINKHEDVTYFGGVGCVVSRLSELYLSYEEASRAFAYRFIKADNQFIEADYLSSLHTKEENTWVDMTYQDNMDKEIVDKFLRNGELGEVSFFVEEYFKKFSLAGEKSLMFRQYIIIDMYFTAANFIDKISNGEEALQAKKSLPRLQDMKTIVINIEDTIAYIKDLFTQVISFRNEVATKRFSNIIKETKEYIQKNYCDEDISLNSVALYVNISPSYLSTLFSQETGQTFVKYLTDLRMNKAKELLLCTNKRSNEISSEVGYKDPHYFSYLFKKTQGCSPMQFRMNKSRGEQEKG